MTWTDVLCGIVEETAVWSTELCVNKGALKVQLRASSAYVINIHLCARLKLFLGSLLDYSFAKLCENY